MTTLSILPKNRSDHIELVMIPLLMKNCEVTLIGKAYILRGIPEIITVLN
jgi:hypothetical protein